MASYVVTVPYVTLKVTDPMSGRWTMRGHYAGAVVSDDDVEPASLRHHLEGGMIAATEEAPTPVDTDDEDEPAAVKPAKTARAKA